MEGGMMVYEVTILTVMERGKQYTSQELTERIFHCQKPDAIYNNHIDDVSKDMQTLFRRGYVEKERIDTGHGHSINLWKLKEESE